MHSSSYSFRKQTVAILGATGQIGTPLSKNLLEMGRAVKALSRRSVASDKSGKLHALEQLGADIVVVKDMMNTNEMINHLKGVETLIRAVPATEDIVTKAEPVWLDAVSRKVSNALYLTSLVDIRVVLTGRWCLV